jgi:lambda family phage portal protein
MGLFSIFRRRESQPAPQDVQARYDAAQTTPLNQRHWSQADWLSADAALHPGIRRTLRVRARYEAANNSYLAGMLSTLATDLVGTGPRLQLILPDVAPEDPRVRQIEHAVHEWGRAIDLAAKLRTMRIARAVDGEAFAVKVTNRRLEGVQLDVRLLEADQVANPTWILELGAIDGLRLDEDGNVSEWHVLQHHPGSLTWTSNIGDWVPAQRVLHWAHKTRAGQHRGVGEIVPALELFAMLRRYTLATVTAAETAADFAALIHTNTPSGAGATALPTWDTMPVVRGMAMALPEGWDATQMKPEHPTTTFDSFEKRLLNQIARCLNLPYIVAALDSSQASYSSMRGDYLVYRKTVGCLRQDLERNVLDPLLDDWLDEAALVNGLLPNGLPPVSRWNWRWIWQGWEHVDPVKEADAQTIRLANNTTTLADECSKGGSDWREVLRQRAAERALMAELGLPGEEAAAPDGTKRRSAALENEPEAEDVTAEDGYVPPQAAREEARRGLEWRREYGRGGTEVGVARARDIANGRALSLDTIGRMVSFFARHEIDKKAEGYRPGEKGYPSAGRIAAALWGGEPGRRWAESVWRKAKASWQSDDVPVEVKP